MRKLIAGLVAGLILGSASVAGAATAYNIVYSGHGITCATSGKIVGCVRTNGSGYSVGISNDAVMVMRNGRSVFQRYQP